MRRWIFLAIALALVLLRSAVFLLWPAVYFDSDQAIVGLMAKHLAELRAFPVFLYGQTYMLGVEAWLAAPLFAIFGPSPAVLKIPLLAMNLVIAVLLIRTFEREMGLPPWAAVMASLPFVVPSPGIAAVFLDSSGGSLEPLLYVALIWVTRRRSALCGLVFGVGFLNREFTIYGLAALLCIEALDRRLFTREGGLRFARIAGVAAIVWVSVQGLKTVSSGGGPGTTARDTFTKSNNLAELAGRTCISPAKTAAGVGHLFTVHWPAVFGTGTYPLATFSVESRIAQGLAGSSWVPAALVLLAAIGIWLAPRRDWASSPPRFAHYLVLSALFSIAGYLAGRCGEVSFYSMRYDMLSIFGMIGIAGWFLSLQAPKVLRLGWTALYVGWIGIQVVPNVRLGIEYATDPPIPAKQELIAALEEKGIRYGTADYWLAYYIDFMTNERMIFAADSPQRILIYNAIVASHAAEAVRLSRRRCEGGVPLIPGVYRCPPQIHTDSQR
jgi:hypothetical protein